MMLFLRPGLSWEMATLPRAPPSNRRRIVATSSVSISTGTVSAARSVEKVRTGRPASAARG